MGNLLNTTDDMVGLDNLPKVDTFLGLVDLRTGSMIISGICVFHPLVYGCTFYMAMSYLLLTIWILLAIFFAVSVVLFFGLNDTLLIEVWIWYTLIFVVIMIMLMLLLALVFTASNQRAKVLAVILGILWYVLTVYFILVVNSHRRALIDATTTSPLQDSSHLTSTPQSPDPPKSTEDPVKVTDPPDATAPESLRGLDTLSDRFKDRLKALGKASSISNSKQ